MTLGKFESGARPGTWSNRQLKFRRKSIIKESKNKDNFKILFIYTLMFIGLFALNTKIGGITKFRWSMISMT
jgi:hypothetical protein